jgi:CubicO group peptidase (beta-lactamase class C family)
MKNEKQPDLNASMANLFQEALQHGFFPGAGAGFLLDNEQRKEKKMWFFGYTDQSRENEVQSSTFYDLASLTKPIVTVLSLLVLLEEKRIDLDSPLNSLIQRRVPCDKEKILLADLMAHSSGLPGYRQYYSELLNIQEILARKERIVDLILTEELAYQTGSKHLYSDLGYILLGEIVEKISQIPLDIFWTEKVLRPLGLQEKLIFHPTGKGIRSELLAATEECPWSGKMLRGVVHDENCRAIGGVAGHAGLFGTLEGVLELCGHLLRQWRGEERHPSYSVTDLRKIFRRRDHSNWCCGFDTPSKHGSSSGRYFSEKTVGHLGFTGTSFWIDLAKGIAVVLLTNRVHPNRENEKIKRFRPLFHNTVMKKVLGEQEDSEEGKE